MEEIELRKVTKENYEAVCDLEVHPDQEDFVASNTWSLVEACFNPDYETRAIYAGSKPVGFLLWTIDCDSGLTTAGIWRFMIDKSLQGKGIGKRALHLALQAIQAQTAVNQIKITYSPKNDCARHLYSSFGFKEVGIDEENEMAAVLILPPAASTMSKPEPPKLNMENSRNTPIASKRKRG